MSKQLSEGKQRLLNQINTYEEGADITTIAKDMNMSKANVYKMIDTLVALGYVTRMDGRKDRRVIYKGGYIGNQVTLPPMGVTIPPRAVGDYIRQWAKAESTNQWAALKAFRQFPYLVAKCAEFGARWSSDDRYLWPERAEIDEIRRALINIAQRAQHLHLMAMTVLEDKTLWDRRMAPDMWFRDKVVAMSPEEAMDLLQAIIKLTERSENELREGNQTGSAMQESG